MKKILTLLVFIATISIFALLSFGLDLHVMFSGMFTGSVSWIVAHIFYENVKDKNFKNPIKKLFFWFRYKRVDKYYIKTTDYDTCIEQCPIKKLSIDGYEIMIGSVPCQNCENCIEHNITEYGNNDWIKCKYLRVKRSFKPLNWIKKLFTLLLICTLLSSCSVYINCNINKPHQKNNSSQQDSTQTETQYWF